ncbi:MAG: DUF3795 domain-containing protein [Dehalococcoidia bacterium]|nr:DUF3795 domain-containing protein [Dehalococcoidia bacterium]
MAVGVELIAPCGMNCGVCLGYLRDRRKCAGCHGRDANSTASRARCTIVNCALRQSTESGFCYECPKYPCRRLRELDKRYRTKYSMSMIENLEFIRDHGLAAFVEKENERWRCRKCGGVICVHRGGCFNCGESRTD